MAEIVAASAMTEAGVSRVSIGVQSFNPVHLKALGRIHDEAEARHAIETARRDFDNMNLDLMYGLPGQTLAEGMDVRRTRVLLLSADERSR